MTSNPFYSWQHTHSIWHHILYTCDITATVYMTRHLLCLWHHTQYIWHLKWCMKHNTTTVSTSHSHCLCNHIHLIDGITPYVYMKSHPLHVAHHRNFYDITSSLDDIIPLFVCQGTHYVYDIISTIYDGTHPECMTIQALYLTWNPFYLISHLLHMSSHPLCGRHHNIYVRYHRWHMYAIMCSIHDTISNL